MLIAFDLKTGKPVGQVIPELAPRPWRYQILTGNGYSFVPAASVRLEKV